MLKDGNETCSEKRLSHNAVCNSAYRLGGSCARLTVDRSATSRRLK
jgi:hypothetical protein